VKFPSFATGAKTADAVCLPPGRCNNTDKYLTISDFAKVDASSKKALSATAIAD
jgi:hypothetical protein